MNYSTVLFSNISMAHHNQQQQQIYDHEDNIKIILQQFMMKIYMAFLFMIVCILSLLCMILYYRQSNQNQKRQTFKKTKLINKKTLYQRLNDLPQFRSMLPVSICSMKSTQKQNLLDILIQQCQQTTLFTMASPDESSDLNNLSFYLAFIQDERIIIFTIDYCYETDCNTPYYYMLEYFFILLFNSSKTIFTCGHLLAKLKRLDHYKLYNDDTLKQSHFVNIQKQFTPWYNNLFGHELTCQQYLKYDEIDGSKCSCSHRPYKSSLCQWSLSKAIMYTFDERFSEQPHGIAQCLAIAKLAYVIQKVETLQELKQLK